MKTTEKKKVALAEGGQILEQVKIQRDIYKANLLLITTEKKKVALAEGGQLPEQVKIQRDIYKANLLPPLLFMIAMMALINIHRKKINYLMNINMIFAKSKKELETLIQITKILSQDRGMEFGIEKCSILI